MLRTRMPGIPKLISHLFFYKMKSVLNPPPEIKLKSPGIPGSSPSTHNTIFYFQLTGWDSTFHQKYPWMCNILGTISAGTIYASFFTVAGENQQYFSHSCLALSVIHCRGVE